MYTVGQALLEMGVLGKDVRIVCGIPLSVRAKILSLTEVWKN